MDRLDEMEELLNLCEQDSKKLHKIYKEIKRIEKNRKKLADYYDTDYLKDFDNQKNFEKSYGILDEDSIWNVLTDQHCEKIRILKKLVASI